MADEQIDTPDDERSPFARPTFIVAAVLVLVIVLLGVVIAVRVATSNAATPPPATTPPPAATTPPPPPSGGPSASVCGLDGSAAEGTVTAPPPAAWQYEGTTAYPTSPEYGPAETASEGYRYCFQHTPTGAVFATANALALGTSPDVTRIRAWAHYFVSDGVGREKLLEQLNEPRSDGTGIRMRTVGFRVLSYTGSTARIDLAIETSGSAQTVYASAVYELVWAGGDWKLNSEAPVPFNFSSVPDTNGGYVPWGA